MMAKKSKITLTNTLTSDALKSFDDMMDDSLDLPIDTTIDNPTENTSDNETCEISDDELSEKIFSRKDKICPFKDDNFCNYTSINDKMSEIYEEFVKDTTLSIANLSNVALNEAYIKSRWLSKMLMAKKTHKDLKSEYKELQTKIREMVSEKTKNTAFLKQKMSIDSVVNNDVNLKALYKKVEESAMIEELYIHLYDIIKGLGFQIRNSIETLNFEKGL